jgi:hypothetical protein
MDEVRQPAVADLFYPGDPGQLRQLVRGFLGTSPPDVDAPKALIVPHAGYVYSGPVAGTAYAHVAAAAGRIRRVVLLGPAHRVPAAGLALPRARAFATPLGQVPVDAEASARAAALPQVQVDGAAHAMEHSLEVQLPFLQEVLTEGFTLVPLLAGRVDGTQVEPVLDVLWGDEETLIVVSSDLSHYRDYETARRLDAATSEAILRLDAEPLGADRACGFAAVQGLLLAARRRGLRVECVDLRSSGDTGGSRDRVVGYGAYVCR